MLLKVATMNRFKSTFLQDRVSLVLVRAVHSALHEELMNSLRLTFHHSLYHLRVISHFSALLCPSQLGNMEGKGSVDMLSKLLNDSVTRAPYEHLVHNNNDTWIVHDDIKIFFPEVTLKQPAPLTVGFGYPETLRFGPELEFGRIVHEAAAQKIQQAGGHASSTRTLLIKTAWGGKDLAIDFRPPSRGTSCNYTNWQHDANKKEVPMEYLKDDVYGVFYRRMMQAIQDELQRIEQGLLFEGYTTWQLKGFVWWQGWNDHGDITKLHEYRENQVGLIRDIRHDLNTPDLPFLIGELGQAGIVPHTHRSWKTVEFRQIQRSVVREFYNDAVRLVPTSLYDATMISGERFDAGFHYFGSASTFVQVGQAFGQTMLQLQEDLDAQGDDECRQ